ncbi:MAG: hypothetical protein ABFS09_05645 [Thermodesulfobacteriota bacterium]
MQQRATRINAEMVSAFSDGQDIYRGLVANISKTGLMVTGIPSKFKPATQKYSTMVRGRDKKFKFRIMPVWFNQTDRKLEICFKIVSPPSGWNNFLDEMLAGAS